VLQDPQTTVNAPLSFEIAGMRCDENKMICREPERAWLLGKGF